jgi:cupin 2 domain-containing protein
MKLRTASGGNLYGDLATTPGDERLDTLLRQRGAHLIRIVSSGQATPPDQWYDQDEDEWVVVLRGAARVRIEGEAAPRELGPGAWLLLPAHCRHRVDWTDPATPTVWLALHVDPPAL